MKVLSLIGMLSLTGIVLLGAIGQNSTGLTVSASIESDDVTTASGVKIDPAKHRVATFEMW